VALQRSVVHGLPSVVQLVLLTENWQVAPQQSPDAVLPSSQASPDSIVPLPQVCACAVPQSAMQARTEKRISRILMRVLRTYAVALRYARQRRSGSGSLSDESIESLQM
jgi:hypothetical protein